MDFSSGDVVIGGAHGYVEHINSLGIHQQHIVLRDVVSTGNLMEVWGATFTPEGDAYFALGQHEYKDYTPHDVCYIPGTSNPTELAVLIGRLNDTVELWTYDEDGTVLTTHTGLTTDSGWVHTTPLKLCVACNGTSVYYTDQGASIFKFDLDTGVQQPPFSVLPGSSPYIYAGLDIDKDNHIYVNMTPVVSGGVGPRRDLGLGSATEMWVDQVNETPILVYKRLNSDGSEVLNHIVSLDPADINSEIFSIAAWYFDCGGFFAFVTLIGAT